MENEPGDYLQVPITERERVEARSRTSSDQPLLSGSSHSDDKDFEKSFVDGPSRFPSIRGESTSLPSYRTLKPDGSSGGGQYAPISPIDEEDIVHSPPFRQRTIHQSEQLYEPLGPLPDLWQPVWLKRLTLALFALLFLALMVAFIVIWIVFQKRNGFYVENPHGHEFWQYIPTILLVFIVAFWRQVDYHCKALMPWDELQKGPVGPTKSLLLDYISPFQFVSLFKAFIHGHIPIIATVSTFIFLKIVMVFSTGTFVLLPTDVTQHGFPLLSPLRFDAASFEANAIPGSISSSPLYAYYGNIAQGMPYASGTLADRAYMPIIFDNSTSDTRLPENVTLTGNVDAFVPLMDCHAIGATTEGPSTVRQTDGSDAYGDGAISLSLPADDICRFWSAVNITALNPQRNIVPGRQSTGSLQEVYCATGNGGQADTSNGPAGLLYTVTAISYEQDLVEDAALLTGGDFTIARSSSRTMETLVSVVCQPSYTITQIQVSNDTMTADTRVGSITTEPLADAQNKTLDNLSDWNMTSIFVEAVSAAGVMFGEVGDGDILAQTFNTLFSLMALSQGEQDIDGLLDAAKLNDAAKATYQGVMAQFARQSLASPHTTHFTGTATFTETRYRVNEASICALIAVFAVAAGCSILLIFLGPKKVVPRDPNSIAAAATVLSRSVEVNRLLRREGVPSLENQQSALEGYEFGTAIATTEGGQSSFKIVTSEGLPEAAFRHKPEKRLRWWQPVTSTIPFAVVVIALPLALIGVLESLQRMSDRNDGIISVPDDLATDIATHYIPTLVMVIVSSLINLIDFNIELFTPWARLKQGHATHRQSILSHYLGKWTPGALLEALRMRQFNVLASLIATMVASILAVVVAGLFNSTAAISTNSGVELNRLDTFALQWPNSRTQDKGAAGMLNMILRDNLDYPKFTYEDLAFPSSSIGEGLEFTNDSVLTNTATAVLPALRANLRCDVIPVDKINVTTSTVGEGTFAADEAVVALEYGLPRICRLAGINGDSSTLQYRMAISLPSEGRSIFAGRMYDLLFGDNASTYGNAGEFNGQYIGNNPPVGCPSLAFTYGEFRMGFNDVNRVSALVCYQEIQEVDANVTFTSNTTFIDADRPPVVDESSVSLMANPNSTNDARSFDFRLQGNIMRQLTSFESDAGNQDFDNFFEAVLNRDSTNVINPANFVGPNNIEALEEAINNLYRLYMAQAISMNMRQTISSSPSQTNLLMRRQSPTTTSQLGRLSTSTSTIRLIQNRGPKIALQIMLGAVSALIAFAYITTHFRRVLPCNPSSIAGTMALLAGSDLCHSTDDGSCECCGRPRRNSLASTMAETIHADRDLDDPADDRNAERQQAIPHGAEWLKLGLFELIFAGKRYSMGWWRERPSTGKRRRFGVDIGHRADGNDDQDWDLGPRASENSGVPFMRYAPPPGGRGDRDGRGMYGMGMSGHSRDHSRAGSVGGRSDFGGEQELELDGDGGDLGSRGVGGGLGPDVGVGRGVGIGRDAEYRVVDGGEA